MCAQRVSTSPANSRGKNWNCPRDAYTPSRNPTLNDFSFGHLSNDVVWSSYIAAESRETADTAKTLALLAEVDERKLYLPAGYGSMADYCARKRGMSEDMAWLRIRVARTGRQFPAIFPALADGRLNQTSVLLLAPKLTPDNAEELLAAAAGKSKDELKLLLAERFPRPDLPTMVEPLAMDCETEAAPTSQLGLDPVGTFERPKMTISTGPLRVRAKVEPRSAGRYTLQCTVDKETNELLRYVQSLLGHTVPPGDVAEILKRSLRVLAHELEKQKFGKCSRPGKRRGSKNPRYIPLEVKRAVWERDGGQCAFVGTGGKRCDARSPLEFDHVHPVARGGQATVAGIQLLCRAHNQYAADRALGARFMEGKREQARERSLKAKAEANAIAHEREQERAQAEAASQQEVIPWLRALGCNLETARNAATRCQGMVGAPLERRVFVACQGLGPRGTRRALPVSSSSA